MKRLLTILAAGFVWLALTGPVGAALTVGKPGQLPTGYLHLTPYEVHDRVIERIEAAELDPSTLTIYNGIILSGTPSDLLIEAGVYYEFYMSRFDTVLRYEDPHWGEIHPGSWMTEWEFAWYSNT
jgi:hypothetical protein